MAFAQSGVWRNFWMASLLSLLLISSQASSSFAETGVTDSEIVIGTTNALSGPLAYFGTYTDMGINCYAKMINDAGGINGRKIKVISEDDQYDSDEAIKAFKRVLDKGAFALSGFCGSACMAKYVPMCQANKIPAVGFYSGPDFATEPTQHYLFADRISNQEEERQFVSQMWKECGIRKIGVIYQNDAYGASQLQGVQEQLAKLGAKPTGLGSYERKTIAIQDGYNKVKEANPQVVSIAGVPATELEIVKTAQKDSWHPLFFCNSSALIDNFLDKCGPLGDGVLAGMVVPPPTRTDLALTKSFQAALKKYYPNEKPRLMSFQGFIDAMIICEGIKRCGKDLTREKFVNALESIHDLDVGFGSHMKLTYGKKDHVGFHKLNFAMVKNSKLESFSNWKEIQQKYAK